MVYYHVIVEIFAEVPKKETDLSEPQVKSIAERYHNNEPLIFDGSFVNPSKINRIKIYRTGRNFREYKYFWINPNQNAEDVTREFIKHPPIAKKTEGIAKKATAKETQTLDKNVFIVHGRDAEPVKELKAMLSELGLNPIVLHELPSGSMTIIEKLEKYSEDVGFAFAVLTPDDVGCEYNRFQSLLRTATILHDKKRWLLEETITHELKPRTRQNVLLEFGFFIGKINRSKVCCLYKGNVDLPSDMHGIVYIHFNNSVREVRTKIIKELKAVGYEIKA